MRAIPWAISSALCTLLVASVAHGAMERASVTYSTTTHAFLSVGHADGIENGDVLQIQLSSQSKVPCTVDVVADHFARCKGANVPRGAFFTLLRSAPAPAPTPPDISFIPFTQSEMHRVRTHLQATPVAQVEYSAPARALNASGFAKVKHQGWFWLGIQPRSVQAERVDLGARVAPFSSRPDLSLAVRMTGMFFTQSQLPWAGAAQDLRFLPGQKAQFFLWQGEVAERGMQDHLVWSVGRILPWYVPGVAFLDGAQVGYRGTDGSFEVGAFGGTGPNIQTTGLTLNHGIVGAYAMQRGDLGAHWTTQNSARVGTQLLVMNRSSVELEGRSEFTHGQDFQLAVTPRAGYFLGTKHVDLEAIRGDLSASIDGIMHAYAGARYANSEVDIADAFFGPPGNLRSTLYGDSQLEFTPIDSFYFGGMASLARDNHLPFTHWTAGPQVNFPRLFGRYGGMSALYLFEGGTMPASSAYLHARLEPSSGCRLWLNVSYITDTFQTDENSIIHEVAYYARFEGDLLSWLHLSAYVRANQGLYNVNVPNTAPYNILGSLQLTGTL